MWLSDAQSHTFFIENGQATDSLQRLALPSRRLEGSSCCLASCSFSTVLFSHLATYVLQTHPSFCNIYTEGVLVDTLCFRPDVDHWTPKNFLFLRAQAENTRYRMLPGRHLTRFPQVALYWNDCGDIRVLESLWVRENCALFSTIYSPVATLYLATSSLSLSRSSDNFRLLGPPSRCRIFEW